MTRRPTSPPEPDAQAWERQERALAAPRERADALLAQALRAPELDPVPEDFAAATAARAEANAGGRDDRLDAWLMRALFALLAISAAATTAVYGGDLIGRLQDVEAAGFASGLGWASAIAACIALTAVLDRAARAHR